MSVFSDLRDSTWPVTENGLTEHNGCRSPRGGLPPVEAWRNCLLDWHVMDAGLSNSIHLFICLLGLSRLSVSALGNGKLTECRLVLAR